MRAYLIKRILLGILTLLIVTIIIFSLVRFIPGSIVDLMVVEHAGMIQISPEVIRHDLGLDVPVHIQYWNWITNILLHGDLGRSLWSKRAVTGEIIGRLPVTFELGILAIITALLIALPIGIYSAVRQDTVGDYVGRTVAIACIALPSFWLGTMVIVFPAVWWGWSPAVQYIPFFKDPLGNLVQFIIPAVILGMVMSGTSMRMTRTMMLEVLRHDYIRTAWAKGLRERVVVFRHALKNALIPVVTIIGIQLPIVISGSMVLEQIFALPGLGLFTLQVLTNRDYPMISGINLFVATFVLVCNIAVDLVYGALDPRVVYK